MSDPNKEGEGMTTEQMNEDVAKWLGRCWHDVDRNRRFFPICNVCGAEGNSTFNPDFSQGAGIILLLEETMKREDWKLFADMIIGVRVLNHHYVHTDYIIEEGALLKAVWEWSRRQDAPRHNIGNGKYRPTGDKLVLKRRER